MCDQARVLFICRQNSGRSQIAEALQVARAPEALVEAGGLDLARERLCSSAINATGVFVGLPGSITRACR